MHLSDVAKMQRSCWTIREYFRISCTVVAFHANEQGIRAGSALLVHCRLRVRFTAT